MLPAAAAPDSGSPADWEAWAERALGARIAAGAADSATIAIVLPDAPPIVRVWGHRDLERRQPTESSDRFLIASVTKVFTASLIARLVREGRIGSLDDPANRYLKRIQLPSRGGREITLRQLLTHSAGFEERGYGMARAEGVPIRASAEEIASRMPKLVRRPGDAIVYANIDPPLLGVLVEDLTGRSYRDLLAAQVFAPLGMRSTDVNYAVDLGTQVVRAGMPDGRGGRRPQPVHANAPFFAPTGSVQTTAADMVTFLAAQLGKRPDVLDPVALALLHTPLARNAPGLGALAMAFFVDRWNGVQVIGHPGLFSGYNANLVLVPERGVGLFVAWAGAPDPGVPPLDLNAFRDAFLVQLLGPYRAAPALANPPDATALSGRYWRERRPQTNAEALVAAPAVFDLRGNADGTLGFGSERMVPIGPGLYQQVGDGQRLPRMLSIRGDEIRLQADVARRVSGLADPLVRLKVAGVALVILVSGLAVPWYARGAPRLAAPLLALAALLLPVLVQGPSPSGLDLEGEIVAGVPWRLGGLALVSWLILGALLLLVAALVEPTRRVAVLGATSRPRLAQAHLSLLALAAGALFAVLWSFHLPLGP